MNVFRSAKAVAQRAMDHAETYAQWRTAALAHDEATGNQRWKMMDQSRQYDYVAIRLRIDRLRKLRAQHDYQGLLFTLNEGIHGNMGGMGRPEMYERAKFGTKRLIGEYMDEVVEVIDLIASPDTDAAIPFEEKLDFLRRAHHCFGQSALMMSGSGMLLYFHIGVVKALWQQGLLPNVISGSSGGAFVGSLLATHTDAELAKVFDPAYLVHRMDEATRSGSWLSKLRPRLLEVHEIEGILERLIPDMTFQEAFEKTGRHLNISVSPAEAHQTSRLLNAITSPNVLIRQAIMASAAVPGVYPPVTLAAKDKDGERKLYLPSRKWVDGAVSDDLPAKRLARLYGVNHFIVSQTNPHVIPFVSDAKRSTRIGSVVKVAATRTAREWVNAGAAVLEKPLARRPRLNQAANVALSILNQDYVGDINILPPFRFYKPTRLLANLSEREIAELIRIGERSAWPKVEMVRIQSSIGRGLNRVLQEFETQVVESAPEGRRVTKPHVVNG